MSIYKPGRPTKYDPSTGIGTKPPASAGEYRIRDSQGDIVYIGETNNLQRRTNEHIRSGKLVTGAGPHSTIEYKVASADSTSATRRQMDTIFFFTSGSPPVSRILWIPRDAAT